MQLLGNLVKHSPRNLATQIGNNSNSSGAAIIEIPETSANFSCNRNLFSLAVLLLVVLVVSGFSGDNLVADASMLLSWLGKGSGSVGLDSGELSLDSRFKLEISPSVTSWRWVGSANLDGVLVGSEGRVVGLRRCTPVDSETGSDGNKASVGSLVPRNGVGGTLRPVVRRFFFLGMVEL